MINFGYPVSHQQGGHAGPPLRMAGRIVGADLRVRPGSKYHGEHEEKVYKSHVFDFFMLFMLFMFFMVKWFCGPPRWY